MELGSGRGRGVFLFLHKIIECRVTGIEWIPEFVSIAKEIQEEGLTFKCEDLKTDLMAPPFSIWMAPFYNDETIEKLIDRFIKLPAKIITVSFALSQYSTHFKIEKQMQKPAFSGE